MDYHLRKLEEKSLSVIREAKYKFKNIAVLSSGSKAAKVCLRLCQRAFFGKIPFQVLPLNEIEAIKKAMKDYNLEALIVSSEVLDSVPEFENSSCLRICPLFGWTELDIWSYIKENSLPVDQNPDEVIKKLKTNQVPERDSGAKDKDKEKEEIRQRLRELGYV